MELPLIWVRFHPDLPGVEGVGVDSDQGVPLHASGDAVGEDPAFFEPSFAEGERQFVIERTQEVWDRRDLADQPSESVKVINCAGRTKMFCWARTSSGGLATTGCCAGRGGVAGWGCCPAADRPTTTVATVIATRVIPRIAQKLTAPQFHR